MESEKQNADTETKWWLSEGKGARGWAERVKGVNCMVTTVTPDLTVAIILQVCATLNYVVHLKLILYTNSHFQKILNSLLTYSPLNL